VGGSLDAETIFTVFSPKKYVLLSIFWFKLLLKTRFYMTAKCVLMRSQDLHSGCMLPLPPLATPLHLAVLDLFAIE